MASTSATTAVLSQPRGRQRRAPRQRRRAITRVVSLDAARGLLALAAAAWIAAPRPPFPPSAQWGGAGIDAVAMPAFAFIAGCAFAMAQHRGWSTPGRLAVRGLILVGIGLGIAAIAALVHGIARGIAWEPARGALLGLEHLRLGGPLEQLGVAFVALAFLGLLASSWAGWLWATVLFAAVVSGVLWLSAAACGGVSAACNPAKTVTEAVALAAGTTADPRATAAVLGIFAGIALALPGAAGAALAHGLIRARSVTGRQVPRVIGYGVLCGLVLGALGVIAALAPTAWGPPLAPAGAIWTPPLTLAVASLLAFVATVLHPSIDTDLRGGTTTVGAFAEPLAAAGRCSLLIVATTLGVRALLDAIPGGPVDAIAAAGDVPSVAIALLIAGAWLLVALRVDAVRPARSR